MRAHRPRREARAVVPRIVLLALLGAALGPAAAPAKTFVLPHVVEAAGRTGNTAYTFDMQLSLVYTPGQAGTPSGGGATVDLYLFDNGGGLMTHNSVPVCAPCSFAMDDVTRARSLVVDELISAAGGPFTTGLKLGFGVLVVSGPDPDGVSTQAHIVNSHAGPFDLSTFAFEPIVPVSELSLPAGDRVFVMPHLSEVEGSTTTTPYTWDTAIYATSVAGLAGVPGTGLAYMSLYLFGTDGNPMTNNGQAVCPPCYFAFSTTRKLTIRLEELILATGAFDTGVKNGYGIAVVSGPDADNVVLQGIAVNSHSSAFDLAIHGFDAQLLLANPSVAAPPLLPGSLVRGLSVVPNPARETVAFSYELARDADVDLSIFDSAGRKIASLISGPGEAGVHVTHWDRRNASGERVAPGVYFGRLTGADGSAVSRVVILP